MAASLLLVAFGAAGGGQAAASTLGRPTGESAPLSPHRLIIHRHINVTIRQMMRTAAALEAARHQAASSPHISPDDALAQRNGNCRFEAGVDYDRGGGGRAHATGVASKEACCALCKERPSCGVATYLAASQQCWFKPFLATRRPSQSSAGVVSCILTEREPNENVTSSPAAAAATPTVAGAADASTANASCYARRYPDLAPYCSGGVCDSLRLHQHFSSFGRCEGRSFACDEADAANTPRTDLTAATVVIFYNVFASKNHSHSAVKIVDEQLRQLRASPLWPFVAEIRYVTIGLESIIGAVMDRCVGVKCVHLGHSKTGDEGDTLTELHAFCAAHPGASVAYMHDKGSFHDQPENMHLRKILLRGLSSRPCADAIGGGGPTDCDVCSMRFSLIPHQHTPGNMWLARCGYIAKLHEPRDFQARMDALYPKDQSDPAHVGTGRYAYEHWVHSHPSLRPCDVLDAPYQYDYRHLPPVDYNISFVLGPRRPSKSARLPCDIPEQYAQDPFQVKIPPGQYG